mgnify:CR=1 FL=1
MVESGDHHVTILDGDRFEPIARFDGLSGGAWEASAELRTRLLEAGTFHWFVEACAGGRTVRSPFASCDIR